MGWHGVFTYFLSICPGTRNPRSLTKFFAPKKWLEPFRLRGFTAYCLRGFQLWFQLRDPASYGSLRKLREDVVLLSKAVFWLLVFFWGKPWKHEGKSRTTCTNVWNSGVSIGEHEARHASGIWRFFPVGKRAEFGWQAVITNIIKIHGYNPDRHLGALKL